MRGWLAGKCKPTGPAKLRLEAAFGIPADAWAAAPTASKALKGTAAEMSADEELPELGPDASAADLARAHVSSLRRDVARARKRNSAELAALLNAYTTALRAFSRLTGDDQLSEAAICRSTPFRKAMKLLTDTLEKHPVALHDVAVAFERFERGELP